MKRNAKLKVQNEKCSEGDPAFYIFHFEFFIARLRRACIRSEKFGNMGYRR